MNKLIKGSIAGAAGIALLLGGAGTLAYWNDSATLGNAGSITAGTLDVTAGTGAWTTNGVAGKAALIVPGDTLVYTENLTLSATGDNLKFTVSDNVAGLVTAGSISGAVVTPSVVVKSGSTTVTPGAGGVYTASQGTNAVTVTVTVSFPSTVSGLTGQGQTLNLGTAAVTVTQVS